MDRLPSSREFDAIVIGSGATGGWAAKELCENGLNTLMLDRGRMVEHRQDYRTEGRGAYELPFRNQWPPGKQAEYLLSPTARPENYPFYASDDEQPYVYVESKPFTWVRPGVVGGKSLVWGRQCYRWSEQDFEANRSDGHGVAWPIRYEDIEPWYRHVEGVVGISGEALGLEELPDSDFQPPMPLNVVEQRFRDVLARDFDDRVLTIGRVANLTEDMPEQGRTRCQYRNQCHRGCSYGAYFSTQAVTLPMARDTGNLTLKGHSVVEALEYDAEQQRVTGVRTIDTQTRERSVYRARIVFLCASCIASNQILLNSRSQAMPNGLGNAHDLLGRYIVDHVYGIRAFGTFRGQFGQYVEYGRRPNGFYIPRFRNLPDRETAQDFLRGYGYQGAARRLPPESGAGFGAGLKQRLRMPGPWQIYMLGFGEVLPNPDNRVLLSEAAFDRFGIPQARFNVQWGENEARMGADIARQGVAMLGAMGATDIVSEDVLGAPGRAIHEMGGACMGDDPAQSVVNRWNQLHVAPNVFVSDGAAMSSGSCVNPTLTLMAMTARAADRAADLVRNDAI